MIGGYALVPGHQVEGDVPVEHALEQGKLADEAGVVGLERRDRDGGGSPDLFVLHGVLQNLLGKIVGLVDIILYERELAVRKAYPGGLVTVQRHQDHGARDFERQRLEDQVVHGEVHGGVQEVVGELFFEENREDEDGFGAGAVVEAAGVDLLGEAAGTKW